MRSKCYSQYGTHCRSFLLQRLQGVYWIIENAYVCAPAQETGAFLCNWITSATVSVCKKSPAAGQAGSAGLSKASQLLLGFYIGLQILVLQKAFIMHNNHLRTRMQVYGARSWCCTLSLPGLHVLGSLHIKAQATSMFSESSSQFRHFKSQWGRLSQTT